MNYFKKLKAFLFIIHAYLYHNFLFRLKLIKKREKTKNIYGQHENVQLLKKHKILKKKSKKCLDINFIKLLCFFFTILLIFISKGL